MTLEDRTSTVENNKKVADSEKTATSQRLSKMRATQKINKYILVLLQSDALVDNLLGKQLKLEREYIRKKQKDDLLIRIEQKTNQNAAGAYTLAEIGDILGLTRERVRQIETSGVKLMKHPSILRLLRNLTLE